MNQALRKSYEVYHAAFYQDLNHFCSGLAALQMGVIFLDLSSGEDEARKTTFDDNQADTCRRKLAKGAEALWLLIPASVEAGLLQLKPTDSERIWAEITKADVPFLNENNEQRVINRDKDVIPRDNSWSDSARLRWSIPNETHITRIDVAPDPLPEPTAKRFLHELRRKRWCALMALLAEALICSRVRAPQLRRQYAQALIAQGLLIGRIYSRSPPCRTRRACWGRRMSRISPS